MRRVRADGSTAGTASIVAVLAALTLAACGEASPPAPSRSAPGASAAFVTAPDAGAVATRTPDAGAPGGTSIAATGAPMPPPPANDALVASASTAGIVLPALDFLPGPLYFCEAGGEKIAIEFEPRVYDLCRRHPEMSPCQYERNACRKRGGRVFNARAEEITLAVEAEYDRSVRRVTLRGDGPAPR